MHNDDRGYLPVKTFAGVDYYDRGRAMVSLVSPRIPAGSGPNLSGT